MGYHNVFKLMVDLNNLELHVFVHVRPKKMLQYLYDHIDRDAIEIDTINFTPCVSLNYYRKCDECEEESCEIKGVFEQVRDRTLDVLNGQTIKSLTLS